MSIFSQEGLRLIYRNDSETLWIEPWGKNSLRIRATKQHAMPAEDWDLLPQAPVDITTAIDDAWASITNGRITAKITSFGKLFFYNSKGELLLEDRKSVVEGKSV